jgi:hypothetical protein
MPLLWADLGSYADLTELPPDADVVGELRALAERGANTACLWWLAVEYVDDETWGRGPSA